MARSSKEFHERAVGAWGHTLFADGPGEKLVEGVVGRLGHDRLAERLRDLGVAAAGQVVEQEAPVRPELARDGCELFSRVREPRSGSGRACTIDESSDAYELEVVDADELVLGRHDAAKDLDAICSLKRGDKGG